MLLTALKDQTRHLHQQAEAHLGVLDPDLTLAGYAGILRRLQAVYQPLEAQLLRHLPVTVQRALDLPGRSSVAALADDLARLDQLLPGSAGQPAAAAPRPLGAAVALAGEAQAWGALYVLEGARLGGQVVARQLATRPALAGLTPQRGLAFFGRDAEAVGPRWRQFGELLTQRGASAGPAQAAFEAAVIHGAAQTFGWFIAATDPASVGPASAGADAAYGPGAAGWPPGPPVRPVPARPAPAGDGA